MRDRRRNCRSFRLRARQPEPCGRRSVPACLRRLRRPMPWDEALVNSLVYDRPDPAEGRVVSYAQAINEALALALEADPNVFVLGQGVDDPLAMFGTTRGLPARFGAGRVFDTPLSEESVMG